MRPIHLQTEFDAPMQVTDLPLSLSNTPDPYPDYPGTMMGYPYDVGLFGFVKKAYKKAKKFTKKAARFVTRNPVSNLARRYTPKFIRRGINAAGRFVKKYGKYALLPAMLVVKAVTKIVGAAIRALIRKIIGRGVKKVAVRRARFMSYKRRGSTRPNREELAEGTRWARKYVKSKGWLGKLYGAASKKVKRDPRVRKSVARTMRRQRRARAAGYHVGIEPATTALITSIAIPVLIALVNKLVGAATKEGAPADPRTAAPEQVLQNQIAEQAGRRAAAYFTPPRMQAAYQPPPPGAPPAPPPEYYMGPQADVPDYPPPDPYAQPVDAYDPYGAYEEF